MKIDKYRFFLSYLLCLFVVTSFVYFFSVDKVLPKVIYKNFIEFEIAFHNYDDVLKFYRLPPNNDDTVKISSIYVKKSNKLKKIKTDVPYDFEPYFKIGFGEVNQIDFAISNMKINGLLVSPVKLADNLSKLGYSIEIKENVIYAKNVQNITVLDLYGLAKNEFIFMSSDIVNSNIQEDDRLRKLFFCVVFCLLLIFFRTFVNFKTSVSNEALFFIYSILYLLLGLVSMLLINSETLKENMGNGVFVIKNNLCLFLFPLILYLFSLTFSKFIRIITFLFCVVFLFLIGIDNFVQNLFGARFIYDSLGGFAGSIHDGLPFFLSYITSYSGFYFISALILYMLIWTMKVCLKISNHVFLSVIFVLSICLVFVANSTKTFVFYNTMQVNFGGWFTNGDYKRDYVNFKRYELQDLGYSSYKGLNLKKDVIVILVESLSCEVTFVCGSHNDFLPNLKQLASDNVFFSNYYSNNLNTNGAIFTITTGFPLISSANSSTSYTNRMFYKYDLINKFHQNGYLTSYYSPARFVLGKDDQLSVSDYDILSSSDDFYYNNYEKNGIFNSVSDGDLFDKIIADLKKKKDRPVFFMLTTISTHTPYITPWGTNNLERAFAYSDYTIAKFIQDLKTLNYFEHGIVIITGDHRGWGSDDYDKKSQTNSRISKEKVPLIMVDGNNHHVFFDKVSFSHSSLGIMLEYLMLPYYEKNKFQINPMTAEHDEVILYHNLSNYNNVLVKFGNKEDSIILDGDHTRFEGEQFTQQEQGLILGYLSWLKQ